LIGQHIDQHPPLQEQRDLLVSIPGIGNTTAAKLLAEMLEVKLYQSARQLAAFAGLVPRLHESGSSIKRKTRLSKLGAPRLRKALYFPAIAAIKYNPYIKAMSLRLKERGLCPMQIIGAAMPDDLHFNRSGRRYTASGLVVRFAHRGEAYARKRGRGVPLLRPSALSLTPVREERVRLCPVITEPTRPSYACRVVGLRIPVKAAADGA
jgi:hypothetical protein